MSACLCKENIPTWTHFYKKMVNPKIFQNSKISLGFSKSSILMTIIRKRVLSAIDKFVCTPSPLIPELVKLFQG